MFTSLFKKRGNIVFLLVVLISAFAFRVTNLDLIEFKTDEAINLFLSLRPLLGYSFPPGGTVSSIGILNPPLFNYLLFPMVAVSADPRFISFLIAVINSISIAALFLIIRRYYSATLAFVTAILMAFSPWAIIYSRKIWMQDLLVPFFVIMFLSIHKLLVEKKQIYWILFVLSSLFLIQLHQTSIVFIFPITLFLIIKKVKLNPKFIFIGLMLGLIPLIPYISYEIINRCPDCSVFFSSGKKLNIYHLSILERPFQILGQGDFRSEMGDSIGTFSKNFPLAYKLRSILYVEYFLLPLGLLFFIKRYKKFSFFAYAAIAIPFLYFLLKIEAFMHYYIIILPLLFLFLASSFEYFLDKKNKLLKYSATTLLIILVAISILFDYSFFSFIKHQGHLNGDYGSTFAASIKENNLNTISEKNLSNFIPIRYMLGYQPLGKMLYGNVSAEDLPTLEKKLNADPNDLLTQYALISFYTKTPETPKTINILKAKSSSLSSYAPIYKEVYEHYLSANFKKEYKFGSHSFFYPEHWLVKEDNDTLLLRGDGYSVIIKNLGFQNMSVNCIDGERKCNSKTISEIIDTIGPIY